MFDDDERGFNYSLFGSGDGGVGFQLCMYRTFDAFRSLRQANREDVLHAHFEHLRAKYNSLLEYAQQVERDLAQRDQQLATTQQELARVQAAYDYDRDYDHRMMIVRQNRFRERERERERERDAERARAREGDTGSQPT